MNEKEIERAIKGKVEEILKATRFSCVDRSCMNSGLHLQHNPTFECRLKNVVVGVDNSGHWCDMYEKGIPEWSRLKGEGG